MDNDARLKLNPQFIIGVCLVMLGGLLMLDRMDLLEASRVLRYWPIVLIAIGGWIVKERGTSGRSFPGFALIALGSMLLMSSLGIARVRVWELFWPLILLFVGARLIMHTPGRSRHIRRGGSFGPHTGPDSVPESSTADGTVTMFSVFAGSKRTSTDNPFRGGEITSIVGGTHLDLRQAVIAPGGQAVIDVFAMMGGHEVWVPQGWTVVSEVTPILGGVEDKRLPSLSSTGAIAESAPRLILRGIVLLGGLIIKN
jgi:predicted membrane protein